MRWWSSSQKSPCEVGARHDALPSTRLATSGRSVVSTSTPSSTSRRIARSAFTVQTPRRSPAARAAVTTASLTSVYWRPASVAPAATAQRSEEHTSELQSLAYLVCRLLLEKKKKNR